jgi:Rrf2 family protein
MLSQKTRYAIRAMQHLADHYGKGPVQLADIAEQQKIPPKFLTVILSELARSGLVASQRGKDGGYWLGVPPIDISYGDLIRIMRGSLALVPCASRYAHEKCQNCVEEDNCRTRALMLQVRDKTAHLLDSINLSDNVEMPICLLPNKPFRPHSAQIEPFAAKSKICLRTILSIILVEFSPSRRMRETHHPIPQGVYMWTKLVTRACGGDLRLPRRCTDRVIAWSPGDALREEYDSRCHQHYLVAAQKIRGA